MHAGVTRCVGESIIESLGPLRNDSTMSVEIRLMQASDANKWDTYVNGHLNRTVYHLSGWKDVIEKTYGHKTYYLLALRPSQHFSASDNKPTEVYAVDSGRVVGILPLIHLKHFLFGNSLISLPFFDMGGILADDCETEKALLLEAVKLGQNLNVTCIELRHLKPLSFIEGNSEVSVQGAEGIRHADKPSSIKCLTRSHKVRMIIRLPESSAVLMKSFKSKLRSQIRKPLKEGLEVRIAGLEALEEFYEVFSVNMRDLGSPVHSKRLMENVILEFGNATKIIMVYKDHEPVACSLIIGFKDTLENPWASSLREYSRISPNMLLYWTMLEYGCQNGYSYFDFGRSSRGKGTFKFKEQWGAKPTTFNWHYIYLKGLPNSDEVAEKSRFDKAIQYWQKLPVSVTKVIGPRIRKHVGL